MIFFKKKATKSEAEKIGTLILHLTKLGGLRIWQHEKGDPFYVTMNLPSSDANVIIESQDHKSLLKALISIERIKEMLK